MSLKLLFVDDSVTMHKVIQLTLESENVNLRLANDGREALSAVEEEKPDVLVADVAMPGINGFELCRQIKQSPRTKDIAVILISGELEEYDKELGVTVGADAHITKPFKSGEFIETVKHITAGRGDAGEAETLTETGGEAAGSGGQGALLELTPAQSAEPEHVSDTEHDEEFEVVSDEVGLDDDIEDEEEGDILSESLDVEGVEMDFEGEGEEPAPVSEKPSLGQELGLDDIEEPVALGAAPEEEKGGGAGQSMEEELNSVFQDLEGGTKIEGVPPADADSEKAAIEDSAVKTAGVKEAKADKADEILDEVFKDADIESMDEELEEAVAEEKEEEIVVDVPEAVPGEAIVEGLEEEPAVVEPEPVAEPIDELTVGEEVATEAAGRVEEVFRDSITKSVQEFMETEADRIFREVLSESLGTLLKAGIEPQLETIVREELSKAIGKNLESAMPEMLETVGKITSQITPKIAEEMIKLAIEQIKKGEAN